MSGEQYSRFGRGYRSCSKGQLQAQWPGNKDKQAKAYGPINIQIAPSRKASGDGRSHGPKTFPKRAVLGNIWYTPSPVYKRSGRTPRPPPWIIFGKVMNNKPPVKPTNDSRRSREYLTPDEIERLIAGARQVGRHHTGMPA